MAFSERRPTQQAFWLVLSESGFLTKGVKPASNGHTPIQMVDTTEFATASALSKTAIPGLLLLPSGPEPPNPAELLGSNRMADVLTQLATLADVIMINTPPSPGNGCQPCAHPHSDGVVLVTALNESRRHAIVRSKSVLHGTLAATRGRRKQGPNQGTRLYSGYYGQTTEGSRFRLIARDPSDGCANGHFVAGFRPSERTILLRRAS